MDLNYMGAPLINTYDNTPLNMDVVIESESDINDLIEIKYKLLNIIGDEEINLEEEELNKIDGFKNDYKKMIEEYKNIQKEFIKSEKIFKEELTKNKENINNIDLFINFIKQLKINDKDREILNKKLIEISKEYEKNNESLKSSKKEYEKNKNKFKYYFEIIKIINNFNMGFTCSICVENNVDHFFNPCGHTVCKECVKNIDNNSCFLCRTNIISIKKLYYL